jgi:hypothetical protein
VIFGTFNYQFENQWCIFLANPFKLPRKGIQATFFKWKIGVVTRQNHSWQTVCLKSKYSSNKLINITNKFDTRTSSTQENKHDQFHKNEQLIEKFFQTFFPSYKLVNRRGRIYRTVMEQEKVFPARKIFFSRHEKFLNWYWFICKVSFKSWFIIITYT